MKTIVSLFWVLSVGTLLPGADKARLDYCVQIKPGADKARLDYCVQMMKWDGKSQQPVAMQAKTLTPDSSKK